MKRSRNVKRGGRDCPECGSMMAGPLADEYTLWVCPKCGSRSAAPDTKGNRASRLNQLGERLYDARGKDWDDEVSAFESLGEEAVQTLSEVLAKTRGGHVAAEVLRRVGTEAAMDALLAGAVGQPQQLRILQLLLGVFVLGFAGFAVWVAIWSSLPPMNLVCQGVVGLFVSVCAYLSFAALRRRTAQALGEFHEPRAAGVLAAAYADAKVRKDVTPFLNEVLPQVTEEIAGTFSAAQRAAILRLLDENDPILVRGALLAVAQFGAAEAVASVTRALNREFLPSAWMKAARAGFGDPAEALAAYRAIAAQTLVAVTHRVELQRDAATLLRAAGPADAIPNEQLLRPAAGEPDADVQQLLRRADDPPPAPP